MIGTEQPKLLSALADCPTFLGAFCSPAYHGVLHKPHAEESGHVSGNALAVAPSLGIVGNHPGVVADVDLELVGRLTQCLDARVIGLDGFQVHGHFLVHTMVVTDVAVPQVALDQTQEEICGSSSGLREHKNRVAVPDQSG